MKFVLVLAIGTTFLSENQLDANIARQLRGQVPRWIYASQWWLTGPTEKSTQNLDALRVFCLALIARQVRGLGGCPALSANSLVSLAIQMGLNRNPRAFLPGISRSQVETMSRLWATVTELLLASHLETGAPLPELIFQGCDVERPSNINDCELKDGPDMVSLPTSDARTTEMSIHLLLLKSQKLRIQILRVINSTQARVSHEKAMDLANQLKSVCSEVTKFFQERKSEFPANFNTTFARKYIDTYLRRHILLLHRLFVLGAQKDPRFCLSHKMCVESAMIMASYTDEIHLPSQITDDFARLMVQGSGHLRGGLSLDVAMTIALELVREQNEHLNERRDEDDPAQALSRAFHQPYLHRLKHIRDQLFQVIELGVPSLKRFSMVAAFLAQFEAHENSANAKIAFFDAVRQNAQACADSLQRYLDTHPPQASDASSSAAPSKDDNTFDFGEMVRFVIDLLMDNFFYGRHTTDSNMPLGL